MSILDQFEFLDDMEAPAAKRGSNKSSRRIKFILGLEDKMHKEFPKEKVDIGDDAAKAKLKLKTKPSTRQSKPDFWFQENIQKWVFVPRYGRTKVYIGPAGKATIAGTKEKSSVKDIIHKLVSATKNGDLDTALEAAAAPRPRKSKAIASSNEPSKASKPGEKH